VKKLKKYSLLVSDMVSITDKNADVMTKMGKAITDVAYNVNDEDGDDEDEDDEEESDDDEDAKLAKKLSREQSNADGGRRSTRLAKDAGALTEAAEGTAERERRQIQLMVRRNEERLREIARENMKNRGKKDEEDLAQELETYKNTKEYPSNVQPNQVKVDMASQCILLPVFGNPVPFHISTIKNVVLPDPDNATLLRINFYTAGMAVGKDAPANMAKLVAKYAPYASFIREMTFRSLDGHNLVQVRFKPRMLLVRICGWLTFVFFDFRHFVKSLSFGNEHERENSAKWKRRPLLHRKSLSARRMRECRDCRILQ
jgi:nucleosome binding factor SPN SPT16 subunit